LILQYLRNPCSYDSIAYFLMKSMLSKDCYYCRTGLSKDKLEIQVLDDSTDESIIDTKKLLIEK
jgi:hypothetical protein